MIKCLNEIEKDLKFSPPELLVHQKMKIFVYSNIIAFLQKTCTRKSKKKLLEQINLYCDAGKNQKIKSRGNIKKEPGTYYLEQKEIKDFERTGYIKPFRVISREDALEIKKMLEYEHKKKFSGNLFFNQKIVGDFKKYNRWTLNDSAFYQGICIQGLWDVLNSKKISQKLASLLGNNVLCWRSQVFEKKTGAKGTFWHQNSFFQETGNERKLLPLSDIDRAGAIDSMDCIK